ncbi:MAG: CHAD domain-containing protein [Bacteroidota bacterium]
MKNDGNYQIGEFLLRFYRKRTASFLVNIYKAGITGASKEIHRARLDVKKILAVIDLLRIVRPKSSKDPEYEKIFKKLYRASGRIREIQVNLLLLTGPEFAGYELAPFKDALLRQEKERTSEFLKVIRKFDEKKLLRLENKIKKEIRKITPAILQKKSGKYIVSKTALSLELLEKGDGEGNVHRVRQHIKELSTVLTLIYTFRPSDHLEMVINGLNQSEMMIGDWHDRVILADSLHFFLEQKTLLSENQMAPARDCHRFIVESNHRQVESIVLDVRKAIIESMPVKGS